jgi:hypothetical protein
MIGVHEGGERTLVFASYILRGKGTRLALIVEETRYRSFYEGSIAFEWMQQGHYVEPKLADVPSPQVAEPE